MAEAPLPPNDNFADAPPIASRRSPGPLRTDAATSEAGEPSPCGGIGNTIWYSFTPGADVTLTADTFGSNFDTVLAAYTGTSLSNLTAIACNDQPARMKQSRITFAAHGRHDHLLPGGWLHLAATGNLTFNVAVAPPPPNDNFATALPARLSPVHPSLSTAAQRPKLGALALRQHRQHRLVLVHTWRQRQHYGEHLWQRLRHGTGRLHGNIAFQPDAVACNDQAGGRNSRGTPFAAQAGTTIFIQVGGFQATANSGNLTFTWQRRHRRRTTISPTPPRSPLCLSPVSLITRWTPRRRWRALALRGHRQDRLVFVHTWRRRHYHGGHLRQRFRHVTGRLYGNIAFQPDGGRLQRSARPHDAVADLSSSPAGTTIFFQVGGLFGETGNLTFNVAQAPPPPNDSFAPMVRVGILRSRRTSGTALRRPRRGSRVTRSSPWSPTDPRRCWAPRSMRCPTQTAARHLQWTRSKRAG